MIDIKETDWKPLISSAVRVKQFSAEHNGQHYYASIALTDLESMQPNVREITELKKSEALSKIYDLINQNEGGIMAFNNLISSRRYYDKAADILAARQEGSFFSLAPDKPAVAEKEKKQVSPIKALELTKAEFEKQLKEVSAEAGVIDTSKVNRLKRLGFTGSKGYAPVADHLEKVRKLTEEQEAKNYYFKKYGKLFLTFDEAYNLCRKYELIQAPVSRFLGDVPDDVMDIIEDFKLKKEDVRQDFDGGLEIIAPENMIDKQDHRVVDYKLVPDDDPIVLQPVMYGYLVLVAWGDEEGIV